MRFVRVLRAPDGLTIFEAMAQKLGREPTAAEVAEALRRHIRQAIADAKAAGARADAQGEP